MDVETASILDEKGNEIYCTNRTHKYLAPTLLLEGAEFMRHYLPLKVVAFGISDYTFKQYEDTTFNRPLYVLCELNEDWYRNIRNIRMFPCYRDDYYFGLSVEGTRHFHMIVLNLHKDVDQTYSNFILGRYSQMYTADLLRNHSIFQKDMFGATDVIFRTTEGKRKYIDLIYDQFKVRITEEELQAGAEYDMPWREEEEIFNWKRRKI